MLYSRLETPRLFLREWHESDLEDLFSYAAAPDVGPAAGWPPHTDRSVSREILWQFMDKGEVWAIVDKKTHKVIGSLGLHPDRRRDNPNCRSIGYVLSKDFWGQGLMTEAVRQVMRYAFDTLRLDMLTVYHYPFNDRSRRVIEKCGFVREGVLRRSFSRYDGAVLDSVCYSLLREEYLKQK